MAIKYINIACTLFSNFNAIANSKLCFDLQFLCNKYLLSKVTHTYLKLQATTCVQEKMFDIYLFYWNYAPDRTLNRLNTKVIENIALARNKILKTRLLKMKLNH